MMLINCDIGERGPDHPVDVELMDHIQMANIACGGHAGDRESVNAFSRRSREKNIKIAAHLSYPDKENFGRLSMDISMKMLQESLDEQLSLMPDAQCVKFHGALYNDSVVNPELAEGLADWLQRRNMVEIVTPNDSELAMACNALGITILREAFAERRYAFNSHIGRLTLVSRTKDYASIKDCDEALEHAENIICYGKVMAHLEEENGKVEKQMMQLKAETICIHSDSTIALELAKGLNKLIKDIEKT